MTNKHTYNRKQLSGGGQEACASEALGLSMVGLATVVAKKLTLFQPKGDQRMAFVLTKQLSPVE